MATRSLAFIAGMVRDIASAGLAGYPGLGRVAELRDGVPGKGVEMRHLMSCDLQLKESESGRIGKNRNREEPESGRSGKKREEAGAGAGALS